MCRPFQLCGCVCACGGEHRRRGPGGCLAKKHAARYLLRTTHTFLPKAVNALKEEAHRPGLPGSCREEAPFLKPQWFPLLGSKARLCGRRVPQQGLGDRYTHAPLLARSASLFSDRSGFAERSRCANEFENGRAVNALFLLSLLFFSMRVGKGFHSA